MEHSATPADYKIVHLEGGDFTDQNGNVWINVLFEGYTNEPIKWVVKDMSKYKVGDVVYGHFETKQSKAGKDYLRFYRDQRQQGFGGGQGFRNQREADDHATSQPQGKYPPRDDHTQESIARSVALKAAVDSFKGTANMEDVLKTADYYLAWLQGSSDEMKKIADSIRESDRQDAAVNPNKPWERITKGNGDYQSRLNAGENDYQAKKDERDEFNDARAQYQEPSYGDGSPLPEYQGDV